ncbi:sperm microtubule inner protein 11 [Halichoeres trimaculatus]|uniref:sperm microtubule inner protein 11 n=1 Tax=Halichoeres trimaculatus TaxID=147232 RepID=UPI003D9F4D48
MAFFGLTYLGYQNPIGDNMLGKARESPSQDGTDNKKGLDSSLQVKQGPVRCTETCNFYPQPAPIISSEFHHRSHERYKEMVKCLQTPRAPNQLYIMPLTDNQQYGWMSSQSPEPWTQVKRFPRKNSEMTKFVNEMSLKT